MQKLYLKDIPKTSTNILNMMPFSAQIHIFELWDKEKITDRPIDGVHIGSLLLKNTLN